MERYQGWDAFELEIGGATTCNVTKKEEDLFEGTVEYATTSNIELVKNARVRGIFSSCTDFRLKDGYDYLKLRMETGAATAIQYASDTTTYQTTGASVTNALEAVDGSDQEYYLYKADGTGTSSIAFDESLPKMATLTVVAKNGNKAEFAVLWDQGAGTAEDPFRIYSIEDLDKVGSGSYGWDMNKAYKLMKALDFEDNASYDDPTDVSTLNYIEGAGWEPIGKNWLSNFTGTFDGNGATITHLYINRPETGCVGFFGYTGSVASITDLRLEEATVTGGNSYTGGLCGLNNGTIENSYSSGSIIGGTLVGGFCGDNAGTIRNSYSSGSVTSDNINIGGFCGRNFEGTIENSYSSGSVIGMSQVGGFCGYNVEGTIENSYSSGSVTGQWYTGGFCGAINGGETENCFWNKNTSGQSSSAGGTGKTTSEMKMKSTFTAWDFDTTPVWTIDSGNSYPYLVDNEEIPHPGS